MPRTSDALSLHSIAGDSGPTSCFAADLLLELALARSVGNSFSTTSVVAADESSLALAAGASRFT